MYRIGQKEEVEIVRLFTEGTYQEIHKANMVSKANLMFSAFQVLKDAEDEMRHSSSREEMAMNAFGICRAGVVTRSTWKARKRMQRREPTARKPTWSAGDGLAERLHGRHNERSVIKGVRNDARLETWYLLLQPSQGSTGSSRSAYETGQEHFNQAYYPDLHFTRSTASPTEAIDRPGLFSS